MFIINLLNLLIIYIFYLNLLFLLQHLLLIKIFYFILLLNILHYYHLQFHVIYQDYLKLKLYHGKQFKVLILLFKSEYLVSVYVQKQKYKIFQFKVNLSCYNDLCHYVLKKILLLYYQLNGLFFELLPKENVLCLLHFIGIFLKQFPCQIQILLYLFQPLFHFLNLHLNNGWNQTIKDFLIFLVLSFIFVFVFLMSLKFIFS